MDPFNLWQSCKEASTGFGIVFARRRSGFCFKGGGLLSLTGYSVVNFD